MSSWDRSESQGLAADESCKDVLAKNRQAEQSRFPNGLPSSTGAEKNSSDWVNANAVRAVLWCVSHQQY